jgi:uncharacterized protein with von Willebrand factor type A (vWA) domain
MFLKKHEIVYKTNTVNADSFDKRRFNELLRMSKGLQKMKGEGEKEVPQFSQLMGDIWSALYKSNPQLLHKEEVSNEVLLNHTFMNQVMEDESFESNREITKLDDLSSALSTISFSNKVMDWIKERKGNNDQFRNAVNDAMNALEEKEQDDGQQQKKGSQSKKKQKEFDKKMQQLAKQLANELANSSNQITTFMKESVKEATEDKNNMQSLLGGLTAGDGAAEMEKVPLREKFALADALKSTKKMKDISEWAGRFKQIARSKQKNIHKESIERSGVSLGHDVERLLPMELANLTIPGSKNDFLRRFAEGQTMVYDKKGKETLGKGPIILCLDESSSMKDLENQSKGFALALMSIAKKQKRDFALIAFSTSIKINIFQKGKSKIQDLIDLAEVFLKGGTNFYEPLKKSLDLINESRFKNADIVFVTDGEANLTDEFVTKFNESKKHKHFECLSILIGKEAKENTVKKFSDKVIRTKDFIEAGKAFEI